MLTGKDRNVGCIGFRKVTRNNEFSRRYRSFYPLYRTAPLLFTIRDADTIRKRSKSILVYDYFLEALVLIRDNLFLRETGVRLNLTSVDARPRN